MIEITATPNSLPATFEYGFATASFQIEGATDADGRGESVWDELCRMPGAIADGTNGNEAIDSYHLYAEDVDLLVKYGATAYR
jgi:beta-glucosidase